MVKTRWEENERKTLKHMEKRKDTEHQRQTNNWLEKKLKDRKRWKEIVRLQATKDLYTAF